jgi:LssY C-terminus
MRPFAILLLVGISAFAQIRVPAPVAPPSSDAKKSVEVVGTSDWLDTGLDVRAGDQIEFTATGSMNIGQGRAATPQGWQRGFRDLLKAYPVNEAGAAALIGRIGSTDTAVPFLIGPSKRFQSPRAGRLFLNVNKAGNDAPDGTFTVDIEFASRGPEPSATPANLKLPQVTFRMIDRIPRRVTDAQGNDGDNTNFVVVGDEKRVIATFEAAGWVKVDREKNDAILHGILATLTKQAYVTLPMSELMLFGRVQDYGLAHAEPVQVVSTRHHLRLWKAPFNVEGQELWVGAATHDVGFDRDQRNNGITHKIDPNVDDEREYVGRSLDDTGMVAKLSYIIPGQPSKEAKTATGATFHSDGRVLVIHLMPEPER